MNQNKLRNLPTLPVGFNDLSVLRSVIRGYLAYGRRASIMPAQQIHLLEGVYQRLVSVPIRAEEVYIPLSIAEIDAVNNAMRGFMAFVRQKVSPSRERDETLQDLERLRQHLAKMIMRG